MTIARVKHVEIFKKCNSIGIFISLTFIILNLNSIVLKAQDTINLSSVNIFGFRSNQFSNGINISKADSFVIANSNTKNLGDILMTNTNLSIKSYGYGGMANVSMRGGNSYQTAVLWNGFNLQDPLNGGVNLSLLPGFFMNQIEVHSGGETSLFGSGAMGGTVLINSKVKFNQGQNLEAMVSSGSFSNYQGGLGYSISGKRAASDFKIYHKQGINDFKFYNPKNRNERLEYQQNAQMNQTAVLQQNAFIINPKQILNVDFWYLQSLNHLPYSMTQTIESESYTITDNGRAALNWVWVQQNFKLKARSAIIYNLLQFNDLNASMEYIHKSISNISELETDIKLFKKQLLMVGLNNTYDKGISESLMSDAQRNRTSIFASYKHIFMDKIFIKINTRKEFISLKKIPLTYSLRGVYESKMGLSFYTSFAKIFRLPTFNDLFWNDFSSKGNPNLRPEWGKSGEVGFAYKLHKKSSSVIVKVNGFTTLMHDLIQWVPTDGVWSPQNYEQVITNGLETSVTGIFPLGKKGLLRSKLAYTYLDSRLQKTDYIYPDDILGKQMMFTPKHKGNMVLRWIIGNSFFEYQQSFIGQIFTTSDNTEFLEPYTLANMSVGHNFQLKNNSLNATFRLLNIWNTDYYVMPNYAMPGINYELSLHLKMKTK